MARAVLKRSFHPDQLNAWFEQTAQSQYTRQLLFSTLFDLMMQVVTRQQPSIHAAYQGAREEIPVTLRAVYDKLNGLEPEISAALVGDSAEQAGRVITSLAAIRTPLLRDYRVKILDGNALGGREHRLAESRGQSAAPLPDKALVVFEPALEVITWMIPPIPKSAPCSRVLMARSRRGICGSPIVS